MTGDAVSPPFAPASFDVVMNRHLLWTLRDPRRAFSNWLELLRPGGALLAFDGQWFMNADEPGNPVFDQHYTPDTRAALPFMVLSEASEVVELALEVGFRQAAVEDLPAELRTTDSVGTQPPFLLTARS